MRSSGVEGVLSKMTLSLGIWTRLHETFISPNLRVFGVSRKPKGASVFVCPWIPPGVGLGDGSVQEVQEKETKNHVAQMPTKTGYTKAPKNTTLQKHLNIWFPPSPRKKQSRST